MSTSGNLFTLNGSPVSWKPKLQSTVALSTAEAEYVALCAAAKEAIFLRTLLYEIKIPHSQPTEIKEDNQSCIALKRIPICNERTKHIDIRYHFTREKVLNIEILVRYCPTENMIADILTKPLPAPRHEKLTSMIFKDESSNALSGGVDI